MQLNPVEAAQLKYAADQQERISEIRKDSARFEQMYHCKQSVRTQSAHWDNDHREISILFG
jgi:hypothetical protein